MTHQRTTKKKTAPVTTMPDPAVAPDAGDFFRAVLLDRIVQCSEPDCENDTRLAAETRDAVILPYCNAHAHVVFSDWMVGV